MKISKFATPAARIVLGLIFFVFGLNYFLQFAPMPPMPADAGAFMGALAATGYLFPLIKVLEIAAGAALLTNRFIPLALLILAPIVVNIVAFHLFLSPGGWAMLFVILASGLLVAWSHRDTFTRVLAAKPE